MIKLTCRSTVADVLAANTDAGQFFFSRETVDFFNAKIHSGFLTIPDGSSEWLAGYLINSTKQDGEPRVYRVAEVSKNGKIKNTESEYRHLFSALRAANACVDEILSGKV